MKCRIPPAAGLGLRAPHVPHVLEAGPAVPWFEVHAENYFGEGGPALRALDRIRERYPVSLHGVGLSIGSTDPLDRAHLRKLARLVQRMRPGLVSEHLSWGGVRGRHFNDLLPLPYTDEALDHLCRRVADVQDALGQRILVENLSSYFHFDESRIPEPAFLVALAERTSCRLLLDVNNVYVTSRNLGFDPVAYIEAIPAPLVAEMHLAGFEAGDGLLLDTHGAAVDEAVWNLFALAVERFGPLPTLIEWDNDLPPFDVLLAEGAKAQRHLDRRHAVAA